MIFSNAQIRERDGDRCSRCGSSGPLHVHHRDRRSQHGGDGAANLVTLCFPCHEWVHRNPAEAQLAGWLISRGQEPADVPVVHHFWAGAAVLLRDDGMVALA